MKKKRFLVSRKLYAGFLSVIIIMGLLGVVAIFSMNSINEKSIEITDSWLPGVEAINNINFLTERILTLEYRYAFESDQSVQKKIEEQMNSTFAEIDKTFEDYEATIISAEDRNNFDELKEKWSRYTELHKSVIQIGKKMDVINGAGSVDGKTLIATMEEADALFAEMQSNLDFLVLLNSEGAEKASKEGDEILSLAKTLILIIFVGGLIVGLTVAYVVARIISKPLILVTQTVKEVANGNLTIDPVKIKNRDEIGELADAFHTMVHNLANLIRRVSQTSEALAASSEQLLASSEQTSSATEQITSSIQEVASGSENQVNSAIAADQSVTEISKGMEQVAYSIQTISDLSITTNEKADIGQLVVSETVSQMGIVQEHVLQTATNINGLSERSKEIGSIVDLISSVSEQTNLLALNAAIEAARAGEHGKGFAVVADEVRKLAEESSKATDNIRNLIQEIQKEIGEVTISMNEGTKSVKSGIDKVNETGKSFNDIAKMIEEITTQTQEVSAIVEEVNASTEEMVQMMADIALVSKKSAGNTQHVAAAAEEQNASMEEIAASANSLSNMAQELQENVSEFKV